MTEIVKYYLDLPLLLFFSVPHTSCPVLLLTFPIFCGPPSLNCCCFDNSHPVPPLLTVPVLPFRSTVIFRSSPPFSPSFLLQNYNSSSAGGGVTSLPASSQKRLDDSAARFTNANFQEVSSAHSGSSSKDGLAADTGKAASEVKNKKNSGGSHAVGPRGGRKSLTSSGKPLPSAVVTMATSSTSASASTGPFHQGELMAANGLVC